MLSAQATAPSFVALRAAAEGSGRVSGAKSTCGADARAGLVRRTWSETSLARIIG